MHRQSFHTMGRELDKLVLPAGADVADVGAYDVNGTYRPLVEVKGWRYTGLDVAPGPNVDLVVPLRGLWTPAHPGLAGRFDLVISGSTAEHVEDLHVWIENLAAILKPGGMLIVYTHHSFPFHRFPIDCWRILPDGLKWLFGRPGCLDVQEIRFVDEHDILGIARKRKENQRATP